MKIALGCDHGGITIKPAVEKFLKKTVLKLLISDVSIPRP